MGGRPGCSFVGDQVVHPAHLDARDTTLVFATATRSSARPSSTATALGRQEEWEDSPDGYPQTPPYRWWRLHDEDDHAAAT